jgi:hypothetical protein
MALPFRLGRKPAVKDTRVARLSLAGAGLADPPASSNWYADVPDWQMLANDEVGDCVVAFAMHYIYQQMRYLAQDKATIPSTAEAIRNYTAIGGYDPAVSGSDQGLVVMGPGGLVEYWARTGLLCGGTMHKLTNVVQITHPNPKEWRQAISLFSGLGIGVRLPQWIMDYPELPFIWDDPSGPIAGYHEMFLVGYETVAGHTYYDCVTWGEQVRLTEEFLLAVFDEGVAVLSTDGLDSGGVNAAGLNQIALAGSMKLLQRVG